MLKDVKLSQAAAEATGAPTPLGAHAAALYQKLVDAGDGAQDFSVDLPLAGRAGPQHGGIGRPPRQADGTGGKRDAGRELQGGARLPAGAIATDYEAARRDFRWPELDRFNWALDWFDAELARGAAAGRPGADHRRARARRG